jgi:tetratricopeptide (TPR) repeat protein
MSGKAEKAIDEFKTLIELDPSARSYVFMGLSYRHLGRFDEAKKYFQEGLKLDPNNASCLFNMGYVEGRQGNQAAAEKYFQATLRSNPDFPRRCWSWQISASPTRNLKKQRFCFEDM